MKKYTVRICSFAIAAVMILGILLSAAYIAAEARHNCAGENCAVCRLISKADSTFTSEKLLFFSARTLLKYISACCILVQLRKEQVEDFDTLVSDCIRLDR